MAISVSGSQIQFNDSSVQNTAATGFGFKNRIINGAMMIDQRNAGAAVTTTAAYTVDRWITEESTDGVCTFGRSTDAPTGFTNSLRMTVTTADTSIGAAQYAAFSQIIEGFNVADFMLGTANAVTFTLSFWVKSSVTGYFNGTVQNGYSTRLYPFAVNITAANTWEYKTVTIAGDTTGSWLTNNDRGLMVQFYPVLGSNYIGASGWNNSNIYGTQSSSNVMATVGNIFAITGVQLEKGSTATSFDYRPYGTELALCQRYYWKISDTAAIADIMLPLSMGSTSSSAFFSMNHPVTMRVKPTIGALLSVANANATVLAQVIQGSNLSSPTVWASNVSVSNGITLTANTTYRTLINGVGYYIDASAEL